MRSKARAHTVKWSIRDKREMDMTTERASTHAVSMDESARGNPRWANLVSPVLQRNHCVAQATTPDYFTSSISLGRQDLSKNGFKGLYRRKMMNHPLPGTV